MADNPLKTSLGIENFGPPLDGPTVAAKKDRVLVASQRKAERLGSDAELYTAVTGLRNDNRVGNSELVQDLNTLAPGQLAAKYGQDFVLDADRYTEAMDKAIRTETGERNALQTAGDTAIDVGITATNILGGIAALSGAPVDAVLGTNLSAGASNITADAVDWLNSNKSELQQDRMERHAIEGHLNAADSQAQYEEDIAGGMSEGQAKLNRFGRGLRDGVGNYLDDPSMLGSVGVEGASYLVPGMLGIKAMSKAGATRQLLAKGMSKKEAAEYLTTEAGKKLLQSEALRVAPAVSAIMEATGGITQTQQAIMGLSEEEFADSPQYQALRQEGMNHEQATLSLASDAGLAAVVLSGLMGAATGMLGRGFEANPLRLGAGEGSALLAGVKNIATETLEEGLQEGGAQLVTNTMQNAVGVDTDYTEGLGQAVAEGVVGGAVTAGPLQAPGVAANALNNAAKGTADKISETAAARQQKEAIKADKTSVVGSAAQEEASRGVQEQLADLNQSEEVPDASKEIAEDSFFADAEETEGLIAGIPGLAGKANAQNRIARTDIVRESEKILLSPQEEDINKFNAAINVVESMNKMNQIAGDQVSEDLAGFQGKLNILNSSSAINTATDFIKSFDPVQLREMLHLDAFDEGTLDTGSMEAIGSIVSTIATVAPDMVQPRAYDQALNQLSPGSAKYRAVKAAKDMATIAQNADTARANLDAEQASVIEGGPNTKHKTFDMVREEIAIGGNSTNNMPSLRQHHNNVSNAVMRGEYQKAADALADLKAFAESQVNKLAALNTSADGGKGKDQKLSFAAHGPHGPFTQEGVFYQPGSPRSAAMAKEVRIDTKSLADLYNALMEEYGSDLSPLNPALTGEAITVPPLHKSITLRKQAEVPSGTTSARTEDKPKEVEAAPTPVEEKKADVIAPEPETEQEVQEPVEAETEPAPDEPTPVVEDDDPEEDAGTLEGVLGALAAVQGKVNNFLRAFRLTKDRSSFLTGGGFQLILSNMDNLKEIEGTSLDFDLSAEQKELLREVLQGDTDVSVTGLVPVLERAAEKLLKGRDPAELHGKNKDLNLFSMKEGKSLNFLTKNEEGDYAFSSIAVEAMVMAVLQQLTIDGGRQSTLRKDEDINKFFGREKSMPVTDDMRKALQSGTPTAILVPNIASTFVDLLGVQPNKNVTVDLTQGIPQAFAASVIEALAETGAIEIQSQDVSIGDQQRAVNTLVLPKDGTIQVFSEGFRTVPDVFTQIYSPRAEKQRYIGKAPEEEPKNAIRNKLRPLSELEKKAIRVAQDTPYKLNMPLFHFVNALGATAQHQEDGSATHPRMRFMDQLGFVPTHGRMHQSTALSRQGKNDSLTRDYNGAVDYYEAAEAYAAENDMSVEDVPIHFSMDISSVGRMQQRGPVTPQGDKITRELITATNATLDLTDPDQEDLHWLTVAQSLGVSVEKMSHREAIDQAKEMVFSADHFGPLLDNVKNWVAAGDVDAPLSNIDQFTGMMKERGFPGDMKALHALLTVARAEQAKEDGTVKEFKTSLAIEADGKTDGPINAMVHMSLGKFTPQQIKVWEKGGLFFSDNELSLNEFISRGGEDALDLYHEAAGIFEQGLNDHLKHLKGEDEVSSGLAQAFLRVLNKLHPDFTYDGQNIKVERGLTKNPLTVFVYGSGDRGIASKVVSQIMDELYLRVSEEGKRLRDFDRDLLKDLHTIGRFMASKDLGEWQVTRKTNPASGVADDLNDPVEGVLSFDNLSSLIDVATMAFAEPLTRAVDQATGGLQGNMQFLQASSQVQAVIFGRAFSNAVEARKAEMVAANDLDERENLPEAEMLKVFKETMKLAPIYDTDAQSFHIAAGMKGRNHQGIARSMGNKMESDAKVLEPSEAGVKASPYLVIGTGDGRMIVNIYANSDGSVEMTLPVFDGVEIGADKMKEASQHINKSVWDGWMGSNSYEAVADSFDQTLRNVDPDILTDADWGQIRRSLRVKDNLEKALSDRSKQLLRAAAEAKARKAAMARLNSWTDHMASAEAPHHNAGEKLNLNDPEDPKRHQEIADKLNEFYEEEMSKLREERQELMDRPTIQPTDPKLLKKIEETGNPVPGYPAHQMNGKRLVHLITKDFGASGDQVGMFKDFLQNNPVLRDMTVYVGSPEVLNQIRNMVYPEFKDNEPIEAGQTYVGSRVMFVSNASAETLMHEAMHAATHTALVDFYDNPQSVPEQTGKAIQRIEKLMDDALAMQLDKSNLPASTKEAWREAREQIMAAPEGAARTGEFLSWALTNQHLIDLSKKQKVYSPLLEIPRKVLQLLRRIVGIGPGRTAFSNLRFNAAVLLANHEDGGPGGGNRYDAPLSQKYGKDLRISRVERDFTQKLTAHLAETAEGLDGPSRKKYEQAVSNLRQVTDDALNHAQAQGYHLNPRQAQAFRAVHSSMMSGARMDAAGLQRMNTLYGHILQKLTPEHFLEDPDSADSAQISLAHMRHGVLTGDTGYQQDAKGRTDLLATFIALSQVSPEFRAAVNKIEPPKDIQESDGSADGFIDAFLGSVSNLLTHAAIAKVDTGRTTNQQLDVLAGVLAEIRGEHKMLGMLAAMRPQERLNDYLSSKIAKASQATNEWMLDQRAVADRNGHTRRSGMYAVGAYVAAVANKDMSKGINNPITAALNKTPGMHSIRRLLSDLRGLTDQNADVLRLLNPVKALIDKVRQDYREGVPEHLAKAFGRKLEAAEWSRLHKGLGTTDITIFDQKTLNRILTSPTAFSKELAKHEALVRELGPNGLSQVYVRKAKALARYMVTGEVVSNELQSNATAIVELAGENTNTGVVEAVDKLTSLYAFGELDDQTRATLKELAENEAEGMNLLAGYQRHARAQELQRAPSRVAELNAWKGYIPATEREGTSLIVAPDAETRRLRKMGYTRIGTYQGDKRHNLGSSHGYWISSVSTRGAFRQGVAQTVHSTYMGVDVLSGRTQGSRTALAVPYKDAKGIQARTKVNDALAPGEHLLPVYGERGNVIAYEAPIAADKLEMLNTDTHHGRMLGAWTGRILEEDLADTYNKELVDVLAKGWKEREIGSDDEFVNVADPKNEDPVVQDIWRTLGHQIKRDAAEAFGSERFFPVRRDQLEDAVGYRSASVTDPWTGISRWSEKTQETIRDTAEFIMGDNALKWIKMAEEGITEAVSIAKTTIIVRSVVVAWENIVSNMGHMLIYGIDPFTLSKGMKDKFVEITAYVKNKERIDELELKLASDPDNRPKVKRWKAELKALNDAINRMSIKPLIDAGEFSTVSENLTEADVAVRDGKFGDLMEQLTDRLPDPVKGIGQNLLITKESATFRALNRMVQYGDFVTKAVLYDHLKKKGEMSEREILDKIFEEFVPYNRLAGRGREALESFGLLWFWNYKLRIQKIAANTLREKPFSALTLGTGALPSLGIDTVMSGSVGGKLLESSLGYSIGPEMGLNSWQLHPINNLVN